jgi:hypothetical protein
MDISKLTKRARFIYLLSIAKIVADITIIIGFFIVLYIIARKTLF